MSTPPVVSVIVPAHNAAHHITTFEVLVIDDGSIDSTPTVARRIADRDPRVRLLSFPENRGVSVARNAGLDVARGEFVATLDADDHMADDRLAVLVAAAGRTGADLVHDDLFLVHEHAHTPYATLSSATGSVITEPVEVDLARLVDCEVGGPSRYRLGLARPLLRRAFLERHALRYDPTLRVGEDHRLYLECLLAGARWVQLPDAHYHYVQRAGSATSARLLRTLEDKRRVCDELLARPTLGTTERATLARYRRNLDTLLAYQRVVEPAKAHQLGSAIGAALRNPRFVQRVGREVPALVRRRWAFHVRRDAHALDMLPPPDVRAVA
jgi:succinoglycan biosynthesis protein ExoO